MAIKGSLKEASLPDVFQLLTMGGKTGCLSVTDRQSFGYIYFEDGRIVYASLLNRRDRLGDILVRGNAISREDLDRAIDEQSQTRDGRRLGEILKDNGAIDEKTLQRYVKHQIEEAVYHLFTWGQGTFYFEPGQRPEREQILVSIDPESLLLEGARRVDEWSQIENKIQSLDVIFSLDSDKSATISTLNLTPEQEAILPYLDGTHAGWEMVEETALGDFEVGKALYGLATAGLVRKTGKRERLKARNEAPARLDEHRNLGIAFYRTSMFDEAIRELEQVLKLEPQALDAEFYLGLVELRQGDLSGAEKRFRGILKRGGAQAAVLNNLAHVLAVQGKLDEALKLLDEGLKKQPPSPRLHLSKAQLQLQSGDVPGARATLDVYADQRGKRLPPLYFSTRMLVEALSTNLDAAVRLAEEGLERHPNSAPLANNAGVVQERKGDIDRARELYERAFELDANLPQTSKNLGDLLYRDGRYEEAAEVYERALRADSDLGDDVYAKLGNVYYKRRERDKAIEMWARALSLNPENEVVRTNLEFVKGGAGE
ncbi:MAG: tetratricopeptide repeat protein [Gemmatimonadetes bacterium]|uniref:Tetratricopeptide repeat protein n=1 Tax=Candidatus Kutchimonas denitrificans TaxID=3056748 RepID=A0AAE4Z8B3_9BACT|nr:tetratricopeptide repeat protein [Gemmatimonadota bacterium]NIR74532.1 tetratricopeptide repeat protein [Candidatus Kutchimonas denitrificans]NIS02722.1 tetratricopeptide repeat protein [Gemmatimonadota bacterium]NIT68883.1 tetratricopeptide repeat protein [Gemmatimonadota bacterium]NIU52188.1 tetratricopeptide repeat protein [Gemmatimonadota bacterium]